MPELFENKRVERERESEKEVMVEALFVDAADLRLSIITSRRLSLKKKTTRDVTNEHADERAPAGRQRRRRLGHAYPDGHVAGPFLSRNAHAHVFLGRRSPERRRCWSFSSSKRIQQRRRRPWPWILHQAREPGQAQARPARARVGEGSVSCRRCFFRSSFASMNGDDGLAFLSPSKKKNSLIDLLFLSNQTLK